MIKTNSSVKIQFLIGKNETVTPEIRLNRSQDGKKGKAIFNFVEPVSLASGKLEDIKAMYLIDSEGQITTRDVNIRMSKNKCNSIEAIYKWSSESEFMRFMRFAYRLANKSSVPSKENK